MFYSDKFRKLYFGWKGLKRSGTLFGIELQARRVGVSKGARR